MDFEFLTEVGTIREYLINYFDIEFWDYELSKNIIEESLNNNGEYILFTLHSQPCCLCKTRHEDDETIELELINVATSVGENNGIGTKVIKILKNIFNKRVVGYSTPEACRFWVKKSIWYDERTYNKMKSCDFEGGGLMEFEI